MVKIDGKPRLCKLMMWPDFDGYGFNLHAEKSRPGQYVGKVDERSPAEAAGLREGDRIIEVNGFNISAENHKQVVARIKSIANETDLLVVDVETDRIYRESGLVISSEDAVVISSSRDEIGMEDDSLESNDSSIDKEVSNMTEERGLSSISSGTSTTIEATIESPRIVVEEYKEEMNEHHVISSTTLVRDTDEDITITHANPSPTTGIEIQSTQEIYVDEPISHQEENQEEDHAMGSTGNSPSPRSTPSPQFSNQSHELPSAPGNDDAAEYDELNLNMTAAEMRERISAKKKRDPRKDDRMDILRKYEIIQTL